MNDGVLVGDVGEFIPIGELMAARKGQSVDSSIDMAILQIAHLLRLRTEAGKASSSNAIGET